MKKTKITLNGSTYAVEQFLDKVEIFRKRGKRAVLVAGGDTLKEACVNWINDEGYWFGEALSNAFDNYTDYQYYNIAEEGDLEKEEEAYNNWFNSLSGFDLFQILRDGDYDEYVEWQEVE